MYSTKQYAKRLGKVIKGLRENHPDKRLRTQVDFAAKADGMNRVYLAGVESGSRVPGLNNLVAIAKAADVPLSEIFKKAEEI
jgi:transcriptional regulator with XRE-family HTH domain